jgi:hypothetical protein
MYLKRFIAVDNVCAWPNVQMASDGTLLMFVFNQPSHGTVEGEIECWQSKDDGLTWQYKSTPVPHEKGANRMNISVGKNKDGDILVLCSGWKNRRTAEEPDKKTNSYPENKQIAVVSRSKDNGQTWSTKTLENIAMDGIPLVPYGNICILEKNVLISSFYYRVRLEDHSKFYTYIGYSYDDGDTWGDLNLISEDYGESALLVLDNGNILAASRSVINGKDMDGGLGLYSSKDKGKTWEFQRPLTMRPCHPANLIKLDDGNILLTYGIRFTNGHGLGARIANSEGKKWKEGLLLTSFQGAKDSGYPSCIQLEDGTILTAFYTDYDKSHNRYHAGVLLWNIDEFMETIDCTRA